MGAESLGQSPRIPSENSPKAPSRERLLEVEHLQLYFPIKRGVIVDRTVGNVHAVDDVSLTLDEGETLGIVGESGCGKTTLSRSIVRLLEPTGGTIRFRGRDVTKAGRRELQPVRRELQMVFQDPQASLNPRKRVGQIVGAPLQLHGVPAKEIDRRVRELLARVGLNPEHVNRFPHEFSGGQRQRIGIARALAVEPKLIMLDEPVSALDVSIQAQVINLLDDLQDDFGLAYVFVAHDLSVVRHVSDRIAVMYLGKIVESSPSEELYTKPIHPYTVGLLGAIPIPDPRQNRARRRLVVGGEPPNPIDPPSGCRFRTRCPRATEVCAQIEPQLTEYANGHVAACHHPLNVTPAEIAAARRSPLSPLSSGEQPPDYVEGRDAAAAAAADHNLR
jgi:oligopeptide/dipeptide ABC transporter ATP-binding protein